MSLFDPTSRTELSELGEFGLIDRIAAATENRLASTIKGIGDDAAVLGEGPQKTVVSTDLLCEGIHFDLSYVPLKHLGYKAVAVNVSDLCAMNARATHITVSIALSNRFSLEAIDELYTGILLACERFNVDLVGGDTSTSRSGLVLSITAIGEADENDLVYRSGAKPTDLICLSGDLGGAFAGLQLLEREKRIFMENPEIQPDLANFDYVVGRQLKPEPRTDMLDILRMEKVRPTAMIDVSDGLSSDLMHLCKSSQTGCAIYSERIPIDVATSMACEELGIDPLTAALNGGEDYELLFTVPVADHARIKDNPAIRIIGHMTAADEGMALVSAGQHITLKAQGWKHVG